MTYGIAATMAGAFAAALLRGFTGFGFGLTAVPLLSLALPPKAVVPLVVTLQVIVGAAGFRQAARECDWPAIRALLPGVIVGIPCGIAVLAALPADPVRLLIGVLIAGSTWLIHRGVRLPPQPSALVGFGVGCLSGLTNGLSSVSGPPVVVYLLALGLGTARMRATAIVYFMAAACLSFLPMALRGMVDRQTLGWALAATPALFMGSRLGSMAFARATPVHHRLVSVASLSALAALLVGRALLDAA